MRHDGKPRARQSSGGAGYVGSHIQKPKMNPTQKWLARVRPRRNPAEDALIGNMRADPNIPWLDSLAAMHQYARQRWPHDPAAASLIKGVWKRYQRWQARQPR
jgi:hypothetical protein